MKNGAVGEGERLCGFVDNDFLAAGDAAGAELSCNNRSVAEGKLPAIAVSGPFGAVKEQCSGLYAQTMAERGFITTAFDPSFTGESSGEPRRTASPDINTEDFLAAVDYLSMRDDVDAGRIAIIGICGWGGIALNAAPATEESTPPEPPKEEPTEPVFDIDYWISFAKSYAESIGLALDSGAVYCWDNPIAAGVKCKYTERDIRGYLDRYAKDGDITDVWIWYEQTGSGSYEIYIGYA